MNHWRTTRPEEAKEYNSRLVAFEADLGDVKIEDLTADGLDLYFTDKQKEAITERRKNPDPRIPNRTFSSTTMRKYAYYLKKILRAHASTNKYKLNKLTPASLTFANLKMLTTAKEGFLMVSLIDCLKLVIETM